jgi:sugar/nucleoside kinase (ribokinase family)
LGGVGRNVAEAAFRAGVETLLVSAVGDDLASTVIMDGLKKSGMVSSVIEMIWLAMQEQH